MSVSLKPREVFELFSTRVEELRQARIIKNNGLASEWRLDFAGRLPCVRSLEPDDEDLRSYLTRFRKFVSKREPTYIRYVHGLCHKHFTSDELKAQIKRCQDGWREHVIQSGIDLKLDGSTLHPEYIADLWINGEYFHDDVAKAAELKRILQPSFRLVRHEFINFILEATRVIGGTGYTVKMALRDGALNC